MNQEQLNRLRDTLEEQYQDLLRITADASESTRPVELDQACIGRLSRMDAIQGQAIALETQRRRAIQLSRIRAALGRIERDEYGFCVACDEPIAPARLETDPATPLCIGCAARRENG